MMRFPAFLMLCLACAAVARARPASAAPPPAPASAVAPLAPSEEERAAKLRGEGNQAMLDMRYVDALAAYQQALALEPSYSGVLYSITRAHQLLGEFAEALSTLEAFSQRATAEERAKVGRLD